MASENNTFKSVNINGKSFDLQTSWEQLGISKQYMLTLLSRDEYTPILDSKPTNTTVTYTDPASGNLAGFHEGQCAVYPYSGSSDGWGLSIAKKVTVGSNGVPTNVIWEHVTDSKKISWGVIE